VKDRERIVKKEDKNECSVVSCCCAQYGQC
jgi:hypothetical protein